MPFRYRAIAAKVALALASVIVTLACVEVVVRFLSPPGDSRTDNFRLISSGYYERHEVVGWLPSKNVAGSHKRVGSFDTTFRTNSRGLRDREHALEKSPSVPRIVVLGDSFTWGYGVNDDEVYPAVMQSLLHGVEVINLGVTAFGTRQEFEYLKLEGLRYQPDTVILGFCLNDIYGSLVTFDQAHETSVSQRLPDGLVRPSPIRRLKLWMNGSRLYRLALEAINTNKTLVKLLVDVGVKESLSGFDDLDPSLVPALRVYPSKLETSFDRTKAELLAIRGFLAERRIRFILALIPSVQSIDDRAFRHSIAYSVFDEKDFELDRPYRLLEEFARQHGIEVVNPYRALKRRQQSGARLYLQKEIHFSREGHVAFAREVVDYLNGNVR